MDSSASSSNPSIFKGTTETLSNLCEVVEMKVNEIQSDQAMAEVRKIQPEWLVRFFKQKFFDPCFEHKSVRNELSKYCIDCDNRLCQYCLSEAPHDGHRVLKIYRHVYKDVVALGEITQHIDCSLIQPYRCNKQRVVAVKPLPHIGSRINNVEELCLICTRKLIDPNSYCYCSIYCKAVAFAEKPNDHIPPFMLPVQPVEEANQEPEPTTMAVHESAEEAQHELEPVEKANQEPEPTTMTVDASAEEAHHEPELVEEANQEPEPTTMTVNVSAEEAQHEPEPVEEANQESEPTTMTGEESAEEAQHEPEPVEEASKEPEPTTMTVEESAEQAQHEPEPVKEANEESEPTTMTVDESAEEAQHEPEAELEPEPEPQTEMLDEPVRNPEPEVSYRKRKRKGTPHRAPFF